MPLSSGFYKQRLQDRLAVDDRGDAPAQTVITHVASEAALLAIPDDAEFVRQAYLYFLRREPDLDGLQYFSEAIHSRGRRFVVDELRNAQEGQSVRNTTPTAPSINHAEERAGDYRMLAMARPLELTQLLPIAGDDVFVSALYEEILCRAVDPDGLAHHVGQLSQGVSREAVAQAVASSEEARECGRPLTWHGQPWPPVSRLIRIRRAIRRLLIGHDLSRAAAHSSHQKRINARLLHHLAQQREQLTEVARAVESLQQSVHERQEATTKTVATLGSEVSKELQRIRAGQAALRAALDGVAAAARVPAAPPARTAVVAGNNVVASEVEGFIVGVPGDEWRLAAFHAFRGVLEPGLTRRFTGSVASGMTVVDVGANVGMYTLIAARAVAPGGKVISFEPTPRIFAILKDNIQVNGLLESGLVDCRQAAVSDRRGTARLAVYRDNNGHNTLFAESTGPEFVEVDTVALDDALAGHTRVDVIKIDAEGAEARIWNGMSRTLRANAAVNVFMEFAPSLLSRAGQDPGAFYDRLVADGFRVRRVHDANGDLLEETRESLCATFSANLMLTRTGA